jgi:hypothetical protein
MTDANNGAAPPDDAITGPLRQHVRDLHVRHEQLHAELVRVTDEMRRFDKALKTIDGEPLHKPKPKLRERPGTRIGPERAQAIETTVRALITERGEVRQADVCEELGLNSSIVTAAFNDLREREIIRLSRQTRGRGGGKFFKLMPAAEREGMPS